MGARLTTSFWTGCCNIERASKHQGRAGYAADGGPSNAREAIS